MKKITYKKILVTFDGSNLASGAFPYAIALAKSCNAEVILLQVVETLQQQPIALYTLSFASYPDAVEIAKETIEDQKKFATRQLKKVKKLFEAEGVSAVKTQVESGFAREVILKVANNESCDLIVMATRGRSGIGRVVLGSVADYIVRHAKCPVLTVHPSTKKSKSKE